MSNTTSRSKQAPAVTRPARFNFLRIPVTLKRIGRSRSGLYADIKAELFPAPVHIGLRTVAYPDYEIDLMNAATVAGKSPEEIRELVAALMAARKEGV
jgi:prophage regulatory protein